MPARTGGVKRSLWLLLIIDMALAGLYTSVICRNPVNEYTGCLLTEIRIRPPHICGPAACFASEKESQEKEE